MSFSGHKCEYFECGKTRRDKNVTLHRFPADRKRLQQWVINCGSQKLLTLSIDTIRTRRVCGDHFADNMFMNELKKKLSWDAVPMPSSNKIDITGWDPFPTTNSDILDYKDLEPARDSVQTAAVLPELDGKDPNDVQIKVEPDVATFLDCFSDATTMIESPPSMVKIKQEPEWEGDDVLDMPANNSMVDCESFITVDVKTEPGRDTNSVQRVPEQMYFSLSGDKCMYFGCGKTRKESDVRLYCFPSDRERLRQWVINCGNEHLLTLYVNTLRQRRVCGNHFEDKMFVNKMRKRLNLNAVPMPSPNKIDVTDWDPYQTATSYLLGCKSTELKEESASNSAGTEVMQAADSSKQINLKTIDIKQEIAPEVSDVQAFSAVVKLEPVSPTGAEVILNAEMEEDSNSTAEEDDEETTLSAMRSAEPSTDTQRKQDGFKPLSCTICQQFCYDKHEFIRHFRVHTGEKPFSCTVCSKSFSQQGTMKKHMTIHSGEKPYACPSCDRRFPHKNYWKYHMLRVCRIGEKIEEESKKKKLKAALLVPRPQRNSYKPICCSICGHFCYDKHEFKRHFRKHTGEKPFTCDVCSKSFSQLGTLSKHTLIHTGDKPYSCKVCKKSFSQKGHLSYHLLRVCRIKDKVAGDKKRLTEYITCRKKHSCKTCGESFSDKNHLRVHMLSHRFSDEPTNSLKPLTGD